MDPSGRSVSLVVKVAEAVIADACARVLTRARMRRGCLLVGRRNRYVTVRVGSRFDSAHRVVYRATFGPLPAGKPYVLHRCVGRRNCVLAAHLYAGTASDNARDAMAAGRVARGDRHPAAVLTARKVRSARAARRRGVPSRVIAARLGVARATLNAALSGRNWAWLT